MTRSPPRAEIGVRFHACRGSMSLGESRGGLPPDDCVEDEKAILKDCVRVIESYHDARRGAMTRVVLGPCSPFSVSTDLLKESAKLARAYKVSLHTHLCETWDEERYTLEKYRLRPVAWMESLDWLGDDVWFAHAIHVDDDEIRQFAKSGVGTAHCPCSNMRLASGIAPVKKYLAAGVKVGLGVDGSASNDASNILLEARQALLLARLRLGLLAAGGTAEVLWLSQSDPLRVAGVDDRPRGAGNRDPRRRRRSGPRRHRVARARQVRRLLQHQSAHRRLCRRPERSGRRHAFLRTSEGTLHGDQRPSHRGKRRGRHRGHGPDHRSPQPLLTRSDLDCSRTRSQQSPPITAPDGGALPDAQTRVWFFARYQWTGDSTAYHSEKLIMRRLQLVIAVAWLTGLAAFGHAQNPADAIYHGGDIVTVDDKNPTAEALAVKDGKIVAVGKKAELLKLKGDATRVIDLGGKTLVPGFVDGHSHFITSLQVSRQANCFSPPAGPARSIADIVEELKRLRDNQKISKGGLVIGYGYDPDALTDKRGLTAADLDSDFPDNPVMVTHVSLHGAVLNSAALKKYNITKDTQTPKGGVILRKPGTMEPAGLVMEMAFLPIFANLPEPSEAELLEMFPAGQQIYAGAGITTAQEGATHAEDLELLQKAAAAKKLIIDVVSLPFITEAKEILRKNPPETFGTYQNRLKLGGIKITADGSPQG